MAFLVRRHPKKTALVAAAVTCFICSLPFLLPLLLISSPFLFFTSIVSFFLITFFTSLLRVSLSLHRWIFGNNNCKKRIRIPEGIGGNNKDGLDQIGEGVSKESRVHEYLEDQLKNLNVKAANSEEEEESGEDPLPCSFSFVPLGRVDASFQQSW